MRKAARVDSNQPRIVKVLRALGCEVFPSHQLGKGFPDLVVAVNDNRVLLIEIKDGAKPPSARKLTPDEEAFAARFPVEVIETEEQAIALVQRVRREAA